MDFVFCLADKEWHPPEVERFIVLRFGFGIGSGSPARIAPGLTGEVLQGIADGGETAG